MSAILKYSVLCLLFFLIVPRVYGFYFTASGDYDNVWGTNNSGPTARVIQKIAQVGGSFHLALGDFSYGTTGAIATEWSNKVKAIVGTTFPFEIVAGNHDATNIAEYIAALPDKFGVNSIAGSGNVYGKQYYFDYPQSSPLARIILLGPNELGYTYVANTTNYNWVKSKIEGARSAGIKWVIVGVHKVCQNMSSKSCNEQSGMIDLINLFASKTAGGAQMADLVLMGHEHNYERSKQLKKDSTCASIPKDAAPPAGCVADHDEARDGIYTKNAGFAFIITGTGGKPLRDIVLGDSEKDFFPNSVVNGVRTWPSVMGLNYNNTGGTNNGILKVTINAAELSTEWISAGGTYTDSIRIIDGGTGGSPTSTPGATNTPTSTATTTQSPTATRTPTVTSTGTPSVIPGDVDRNGAVNFSDLQLLITQFGRYGQPSNFTGNTLTDISDFGVVVSRFGL